MDSSELRSLVERVTRATLEKLQPEPVSVKGKFLIFSDESAGQTITSSSNCMIWHPAINFQPEELEGVEIAAISVTNLAKLVHFLWDNPFLEALGKILLCGKSATVTDPKWKEGNPWKKQNKTFSMALSPLVERAGHLGILFEGGSFTSEIVSPGNVLTEEDIIKYHEKGIRTILTPSGCIVTPLARDAARDRGIHFRAMDKKQQ